MSSTSEARLSQRGVGSTVAFVTAAACAAVAAGSCAFGPGKVKVPVDVPASFSQSGSARLPDRWWRSLKDPELDRLISQALRGNLDLMTVWDRLDQARAEARKAGAGRLPSLDVQAGAGLNITKAGPTPNLLLGAAASYEVDLWGRLRATHRAAVGEVLATRQSLRAAAISLTAEVATTWYQLVETYGQIKLLREQRRGNQQMLKLVGLRLGIGKASAVDLLQQRQLVESTLGDLAQVEANAAILEHRLSVLLGKPPRTRVVRRRTTLIPLPALPKAGVPAELIRRRPDVRQAFYKVRAANQRVAAAIADRFPRLSLSAGAQVSDDGVRNLFNNWLVNLAANLVAPILDFGRRKAEVARTRAAASEALHAYGKAVLTALREVEDALAKERHGLRRQKSLDDQLGLSRLAVDSTLDRFLNGAEEYLRVLDAQIRHQTLQRTRLTVHRELIENRIALCRALAGGWKLRRPASPRAAKSKGPRKPSGPGKKK